MIAEETDPSGDMSTAQFKELLQLIRDLTGISMTEAKRQLVERRLATCMKASGIASVEEYLARLNNNDATEVERFSNAVTTNLTAFYRESHHFDFFENTVLQGLRSGRGGQARRLRVWSAGCSTGEEPYSIAMSMREALPDVDQWDAKVLCTDIDSQVIRTAEAGVYQSSRLDGIDNSLASRWFLRGKGENEEKVKAKESLRRLLTFRRLNLMEPWPINGLFDVIFCRNVIIYFDKPTQRKLIDRYADQLQDNAYLILGHSESLHQVSDRFQLLGKTVYQKIR